MPDDTPTVDPRAPEPPRLHVEYFDQEYNDTHPDVRTWQEQMSWRGWTIAVDQIFGAQSSEVAMRFQADKDLVVDGMVGPETWNASWEEPVTATELTVQREAAGSDEDEHA